MAADFKVARPIEFYRQFLKEDIRPDGRGLDEFRETLLNQGSIGNAEGSALVKLGNTTVLCGIKAEVAEPALESPNIGYLVSNVELPALCSPSFRPGPPSDKAQALSQFLADVCKNSQIVGAEDLCIVKGKLCWVLYADIVCLNYDGNLTDASLLGLLAALHNTSLPKIKINQETGLPERRGECSIPLRVNANPVATSFATIDNSYLLVDATNEEEDIATGSLTVVVTEDGRLCSVLKPGGTPIDDTQLQKCISRALSRAKEVEHLITAAKGSPER